jgi:hypothetical protein
MFCTTPLFAREMGGASDGYCRLSGGQYVCGCCQIDMFTSYVLVIESTFSLPCHQSRLKAPSRNRNSDMKTVGFAETKAANPATYGSRIFPLGDIYPSARLPRFANLSQTIAEPFFSMGVSTNRMASRSRAVGSAALF